MRRNIHGRPLSDYRPVTGGRTGTKATEREVLEPRRTRTLGLSARSASSLHRLLLEELFERLLMAREDAHDMMSSKKTVTLVHKQYKLN